MNCVDELYLLNSLERLDNSLPILRLRLQNLPEAPPGAVPIFVPVRPILHPVITLNIPRSLLRFLLQSPPIIQFHSQHSPMELHTIELHRLHGRLGRHSIVTSIYHEPKTGDSVGFVVRLDENDVVYGAELTEKLGHLVLLYPVR